MYHMDERGDRSRWQLVAVFGMWCHVLHFGNTTSIVIMKSVNSLHSWIRENISYFRELLHQNVLCGEEWRAWELWASSSCWANCMCSLLHCLLLAWVCFSPPYKEKTLTTRLWSHIRWRKCLLDEPRKYYWAHPDEVREWGCQATRPCFAVFEWFVSYSNVWMWVSNPFE